MSAIETFKHNGYTVKLYQDEDACNPRKEFDHAGTMVCWHRSYDLGDETRRDDASDFLNELANDVKPNFGDRWDNELFNRMVPASPNGSAPDTAKYAEQRKAWAQARYDAMWKIVDAHYVILPLSLLDHSGLHIWVGEGPHWSDSAGWDSGQVGWIYIDRAKAIEEFGGKSKRFTKKVRKQAEDCLRAEVEEYDQYLRGDVYGYQIENSDGDDVDSCWGFYGLDYARQEAKDNVPEEPCPVNGEAEDNAAEETLA